MELRNSLPVIMALFLLSCTDNAREKIQTSRELSQSIAEAQKNTIPFEGRFVDIHKINYREYYISLQNGKERIETFLTIMPIDEQEIKLLKKTGNNIRLSYINFYNPVRKRTEKVVRSMEPIYEPLQK